MNKKIKCKPLIAALALIAIVCEALSFTACFLQYGQYGGNYLYANVTNAFMLLLELVPCVLLLLYVCFFNRQYKGTVLYPVACGWIASEIWLGIIGDIVSGVTYWDASDWLYLAVSLAAGVAFILLTLDATKGLGKKLYTVIAAALGITVQLFSAVSLLRFMWGFGMWEDMYLYFLWNFLSIIGTTALFTALLLFGLNNRIPIVALTSNSKQTQKEKQISPEQSLLELKDKFELGMITEEEYLAQRADIINKL